MDPLTLTVLLAVAGYCVAAPDRRTLAASRGTAGAVKAAAVGGTRQVRDDWAAGRSGRAAAGRRIRTKFQRRTAGSVAVALWDCAQFTARAGRGTARAGYRTGRAAASSARSGYAPSVARAKTKRARKLAHRRLAAKKRAAAVTPPGVTALLGNRRHKTDDWTVTLNPQADGTTRADIYYAGLPDLGAQPVTTASGATPEEAQIRAEDAIAYQQMRHGAGAPARIAWIRPDQPDGTSPSGGTSPTPTTGDPMLKNLIGGELTTTSDLHGEAKELRHLVEDVKESLARLNEYLTGVGDRYVGAPFGTEKLSRAISGLGEQAKAVDPVVADHILEQTDALEEALTEADALAEHASAVKAEGEIHAFQPA